MIDQKLIKFIINDIQPFNILVNQHFRTFVNSLNPSYNIPSQHKIDQIIEFSFQNTRQTLMDIINSVGVESVSLTCDFWTSRGRHGYIGVTSCFLNENFEFNEMLLALQHVPYPHTAEVIYEKLKEIIYQWGIQNKVFTLTTDNGANMVKAAKLLKDDI